ncbi:DNA-deoxyinosine glycosylase [Arenimonas composti]|uniref:Uracil-DNA glycosylase-like domain-containing protein n=1 Tax=Arenimonas composti TR7-09 = DSM 18010 TaxID=1121013 RepID=A0A091BF38_9GAMM|nr:DNA-deoxyinosine glycosylase [Arenimonas composti]KFN50157.1 hypothetical protein P873_07930 [Arenimonas composti TR7-09 = DSM 18010]
MPKRPAAANPQILTGLPPITSPAARVLVLGSMPGVESLRQQQYYAHPRNHFWPIVGELFGIAPELPYAERTQRLADAGVAVWDVLAECVRPGSLDSAIDAATARVNDFAGFFAAFPGIRAVFNNGTYSANTFRTRVMRPGLLPAGIAVTRLPSTSPANASLDFAAKLRAWRVVAEAVAASKRHEPTSRRAEA